MPSLLSVSLVLLLPFTTVGEPCAFGPLSEPSKPVQEATAGARDYSAGANSQEAAVTQAAAHVDPKLLKKKVVVRCHDGRMYKGKLIELTPDLLGLRMGKRTERIALTEVAGVERQRSRVGRRVLQGVAAAGIVAGIVGLIWLIGASRD